MKNCKYALRRRSRLEKMALDPVSLGQGLYGAAGLLSAAAPHHMPHLLQQVLDPASAIVDGLSGGQGLLRSGIGAIAAGHLFPIQNAALGRLPGAKRFAKNVGEHFVGEAFQRGLQGKPGMDLGKRSRTGALARFSNDHIVAPVYGSVAELNHVHAVGHAIRSKLPQTAAWLAQHPERAADFVAEMEGKGLIPTEVGGKPFTLSGALRSTSKEQKPTLTRRAAQIGLMDSSEWLPAIRAKLGLGQPASVAAPPVPAAAAAAPALPSIAAAPIQGAGTFAPSAAVGGSALRDYVRQTAQARMQKNRPGVAAFYGSGVPT